MNSFHSLRSNVAFYSLVVQASMAMRPIVGIRALMHYLEEMARKESISSLTVSSSITAEGFYQKLGYSALRNEYYGEERTIIMEKKLSELP